MKNINLEYISKSDNNNLDLIRLVFAVFVIYGHSFAVNPSPNMGQDLIFVLTGHYAGDIAIKGFFLISGFLVTGSILHSGSPIRYIISRFFRIWPALFTAILVSALIIGPIVTTLTLSNYFHDPLFWNYIWKNASLQNWGGQSIGDFNLPGVFAHNIYPKNVNAPLWSLTPEAFGYIAVLSAFLSGILNKRAYILVFCIIILDSLLPEKFLFYFLPQNSQDFSALPFCFAFGSIMAVFKREIKLSYLIILGAFLSEYLLGGPRLNPLLFYIILFVLIFRVSSTRIVRSIRVPYDISYGVFLYGWPIQQTIAVYFPNWPHSISLSASIAMALIAGFLSCILIERPSRKFGKMLIDFLHTTEKMSDAH